MVQTVEEEVLKKAFFVSPSSDQISPVHLKETYPLKTKHCNFGQGSLFLETATFHEKIKQEHSNEEGADDRGLYSLFDREKPP